MSSLPYSKHPNPRRPKRVRPAEYTPAVLRIEDGSCTQATLQLFSITGGLLLLPKPLDRGSRARLLFLTQSGPVLGMAEMLKPVSWTEQPFRFIGLEESDRQRLHTATGQPRALPARTIDPPVLHTARTPEPATPEPKPPKLEPEATTSHFLKLDLEPLAQKPPKLEPEATTSHFLKLDLAPLAQKPSKLEPEEPARPAAPAFDSDDAWIRKFRDALENGEEPPSRLPRVFAALMAASIAIVALVYYVQGHLLAR